MSPRFRVPCLLILVALALPGAVWSQTANDLAELQLSDTVVRAGDRITAVYRPDARLASESGVVVRAEVHRSRSDQDPPRLVLGRLDRGADGTFRGALTVPDTLVYAALAVESMDGETVDFRRSGWELLHGDIEGSPAASALATRVRAVRMRDIEAGWTAAERYLERHPDDPAAWEVAAATAGSALPEAERAAFDDRARTRLAAIHAELQERDDVPPETMASLVFLARMLEEGEVSVFWRDRLVGEHPRTPGAAQQRVFIVFEDAGADVEARSAALERLWEEVGDLSPQLAMTAYMSVRTGTDLERLEVWGERAATAIPGFSSVLAQDFLRHEPLRQRGMDVLRSLVAEIDRSLRLEDDPGRPLDRPRSVHRTELTERRGYLLTDLGIALADAGRYAAARDTLTLATEVNWSAPLHERLGDLEVRFNRPERAKMAYARVAVDPEGGADFTAAARERIGPGFDDGAWRAALDRARLEMADHVRARLEDREVAGGPLRFLDQEGRPVEVDPRQAPLTLVAAWSRFCPHSVRALPEMAEVGAALRDRGVYVAAITDEPPGPGVAGFLEGDRLTLPVYHDVEREGPLRLGQRGTPHYLLLQDWQVVLDTRSLADVMRAAEVILAEGDR